MPTPEPLTTWQRLRVTAAVGLPVKVTPDELRSIAKAGEHLEMMIDQNVTLIRDKGVAIQRKNDLADSSRSLRRALLVWQGIGIVAVFVAVAAWL